MSCIIIYLYFNYKYINDINEKKIKKYFYDVKKSKKNHVSKVNMKSLKSKRNIIEYAYIKKCN